MTPLQRLEHGLHPVVAFVVMPIFAFANAGVEINGAFFQQVTSPVTLGILAGLLLGKFVGVVGMVTLFTKMNLAELPEGMNRQHLVGAGFLAAIGFTMSLFISSLAFENPQHISEAKLGILIASVLASLLGYFTIQRACRKS
jgi:Na+:H+ antiporter, NhaA family